MYAVRLQFTKEYHMTDMHQRSFGTPILQSELDEFERRFEATQVKKKERERRLREDVILKVAVHEGCGGHIVYHSRFVIACAPHEVLLGGVNLTREETKCSCDTCGLLFDPEFPPFRRKVLEHRNREVDD